MDAPGLVRGIALFAVNILILWVVERLLGKSQRRVVPEVSDHNRPVARYNAAEPGAQS
jgi:hypothetical protein